MLCIAAHTGPNLFSKARFAELHIGSFRLLVQVTTVMTVALLRPPKLGVADGRVCPESAAMLQAMRGSAKA